MTWHLAVFILTIKELATCMFRVGKWIHEFCILYLANFLCFYKKLTLYKELACKVNACTFRYQPKRH